MKLLALLTTWILKGADAVQPLVSPAFLGLIVTVGVLFGVPWLVERRRWQVSLEQVRETEREAVRTNPLMEVTARGRKWGLFSREPLVARLLPDGFELERKDHVLEGSWSEVTRWERTGLADWTLYFGDEKHEVGLKGRDGFSKSDRWAFDRRMSLYTEDIRELGHLEALRMTGRRMVRALLQALPRSKRQEISTSSIVEPTE